MYPEILSIGSFTIHSYGLMIALAILVAALGLYREAPRENINPDHMLEAVVVTPLIGLFGARLLYMLLNWDIYSGRFFSQFFTRFEGLSFYGGLFGGMAALLIWSYRRKIGFLKMADLLAPYLILGYAFGRIGCFLNGCCYGREATVPWAFSTIVSDTVLRHPVQLYAALGAILIVFILKKLRPHRPFVGFVFLSMFTLYGLLRFSTEFFRHGHAVWIGLTDAQLFSLALVFLSLVAILVFINPGELLFKSPAKSKKTKKKNKAAKK